MATLSRNGKTTRATACLLTYLHTKQSQWSDRSNLSILKLSEQLLKKQTQVRPWSALSQDCPKSFDNWNLSPTPLSLSQTHFIFMLWVVSLVRPMTARHKKNAQPIEILQWRACQDCRISIFFVFRKKGTRVHNFVHHTFSRWVKYILLASTMNDYYLKNIMTPQNKSEQ